MKIQLRIAVLTAALVLVEVASFWKLSHWLFWSNEDWLAYTSALAFVVLLLAAIIAMGSDISQGMRKQFYVGGLWLLAIQGLANVLIAYQRSLTMLPVDVVVKFFNITPDAALKSMAFLQGASLSAVSICFWSVIGAMVRTLWEQQHQQQDQLKKWDDILQEVSDEQ